MRTLRVQLAIADANKGATKTRLAPSESKLGEVQLPPGGLLVLRKQRRPDRAREADKRKKNRFLNEVLPRCNACSEVLSRPGRVEAFGNVSGGDAPRNALIEEPLVPIKKKKKKKKKKKQKQKQKQKQKKKKKKKKQQKKKQKKKKQKKK